MTTDKSRREARRFPLLAKLPKWLGVVSLGMALTACQPEQSSRSVSEHGDAISTSGARAPAALTNLAEHTEAAPVSGDGPAMTVYKSPTCGCCAAWADHLVDNGFAVRVVDEAQMNPLKASLGVPGHLRSCHTARVGDYVIEGHVPAADIHALLRQSPDVVGLAVPGMPIGSPGMEMGDVMDAYSVIAFDEDSQREFAQHGPMHKQDHDGH